MLEKPFVLQDAHETPLGANRNCDKILIIQAGIVTLQTIASAPGVLRVQDISDMYVYRIINTNRQIYTIDFDPLTGTPSDCQAALEQWLTETIAATKQIVVEGEQDHPTAESA